MTASILVAVFSVALGVGLGIPAGAVTATAKLHCHPTPVHVKRICVLHFTDSGKRKDRKVCFATASPNKVTTKSGDCTTTSKGGRADGIFRAVQPGTATVTATESMNGQTIDTVSVSVIVVAS
ncbi:MAG TPA: hypothetical protein VK771_03250 [Acidimicrobiia bacterium]|nr:hypothetical protein [Acidimicrobiia bacterium]